jgi:hypothetical protein
LLKRELFYYEGSYQHYENHQHGPDKLGDPHWARVRVMRTTLRNKENENPENSVSADIGDKFKDYLTFFVSLYYTDNEISEGYRVSWNINIDDFVEKGVGPYNIIRPSK